MDLELEVMRGPGSIPTGGNILSLDFFQIVKPLMLILASLLNVLGVAPSVMFQISFRRHDHNRWVFLGSLQRVRYDSLQLRRLLVAPSVSD